jgi:hypothetical protein
MLRAILKEAALLKELGRRLSSPKPKFWKRVQARTAATATGLGGMVASGHAPESLLPYLKGAALVFGGIALAAQLPDIDGSETPPPTDSSAL